MENEFRNIETLIREIIDFDANPKSDFEHQLGKAKNAIVTERARISFAFPLKAISLESEGQIKVFFRYHQQVLINLLDELFTSMGSKTEKRILKKDLPSTHLIPFLGGLLEDLLNYLQNQFPEYYDLDIAISEFRKEKILKAVKESSELLEVNLSKFACDPALLSICRKVLSDFLKAFDSRITFRKVVWIKELIKQLIELTESEPEGKSLDSQIRFVLLNLNYNQDHFYFYYTEFLVQSLAGSETVSGKLEKLAFHYKTINQIQIKRGFEFDQNATSLKQQLTDWVVEEIQFLEKMRQLSTEPTGKEDGSVKPDFKLNFDMSVSQFAYFIRLFIETGVIQNKNISELIRFLTKFVKTRRSESISSESFRIKYYDTESATKQSVKGVLQTAIGYINNN